MRLWVVGLGITAALGTGCEAFSAKAGVAAQAGNSELKSERVALILGKSGGGPTLQAAEFVSDLWLDYSLFANAVASKEMKTDSATVVKMMWPQIAQARVKMWHDTVVAKRAQISPTAIDSIYNSPEYRLFQHIIIRPAGTTPADTAKAQTQIKDALAKVKAGADFGKLAAEVSGDGSKTDAGYLGAGGGKGAFVKEFEEPAWLLAPGQVSGVVKSQFGYHIIRRPPLEEVRTRLGGVAREHMSTKVDSLFMDELSRGNGLKVNPGAGAALRSVVTDLSGASKSNRSIVSLKGGDLTLKEAARWIGSMPPQTRMQVRAAPDSVLGEFAKGLAQNVLLLRQADSAGIKLTPPQWQFLQLQYSQNINGLKGALGLAVPELGDSSKLSPAERSTLAASKIDDYFARLVEGKAQVQQVMPSLAAQLRMEGKGRVNQAGIARAVELAQVQFKKDSAAAGAGGKGAPPPMQRAPGGPPVPTAPPAPADSTKGK